MGKILAYVLSRPLNLMAGALCVLVSMLISADMTLVALWLLVQPFLVWRLVRYPDTFKRIALLHGKARFGIKRKLNVEEQKRLRLIQDYIENLKTVGVSVQLADDLMSEAWPIVARHTFDDATSDLEAWLQQLPAIPEGSFFTPVSRVKQAKSASARVEAHMGILAKLNHDLNEQGFLHTPQ